MNFSLLKKSFVIILVILANPFTSCLLAQETNENIDEKILYGHERSFRISIHSQGLEIGYRQAKIKSSIKNTFFDFSFGSLKSLKEVKMMNPYYFNTTYFVYGKLNNVFALRGSYGFSKQITRKPYFGGVELRWLYQGGLSFGIEKPYYYYFEILNEDNLTSAIVEGRFDDETLQWIDIIGRAPFKKGLSEISISPGVFGKIAIQADLSKTKTKLKQIEIGAVLEYFPLSLAIMENPKNEKLFLTFSLSYSWGPRYNKY